MKSVAVITTLYKSDSVEYFQEALLSLKNQTLKNYDIKIYLCIDGPVSKSREELIEINKDSFYKVIKNEQNIGLANSLNKLIEIVEDEQFIFRMDMDDICFPDRFKKQVNYLIQNPDISLVGCNSKEINEDGDILFEKIYPETHSDIIKASAKCMPILHPTCCFRREVFNNENIRYPNEYLTEDLGLFFILAASGLKFHNLQEPLFYWRTTSAFFDRRNLRRSLIEFKVFTKGIYSLYGLSYKYVFPLMRLGFRFFPKIVASKIYRSKVRAFLK